MMRKWSNLSPSRRMTKREFKKSSPPKPSVAEHLTKHLKMTTTTFKTSNPRPRPREGNLERQLTTRTMKCKKSNPKSPNRLPDPANLSNLNQSPSLSPVTILILNPLPEAVQGLLESLRP